MSAIRKQANPTNQPEIPTREFPRGLAELLTPDELAERLKVPRTWVFEKTRRRCRDPLPVLRLGKYVRFDWPAVERWLREHKN